MRGVAPLMYTDSTALPLRGDRQGRVPHGPYFFFFLVAFFLATASPPFVGVLEMPLLGMLVRRPNSVKIKIPYIGVAEAPAPQI